LLRPQAGVVKSAPAAGLQGHSRLRAPTIKYDALFLVKSSIVLQFGIRAECVFHSSPAGLHLPAPRRIQDGVLLHPDKF